MKRLDSRRSFDEMLRLRFAAQVMFVSLPMMWMVPSIEDWWFVKR